MEMAQAVCDASVVLHVFATMLKSPLTAGACSVAATPPVFATVIICAAAL